MQSNDRKFDLVLLGANGYTGKLTAEHITTHLPTNITWAVAGRTHSKLAAVVDEIKRYNPDRKQPEILTLSFDSTGLLSLAQESRLVINCVGPYSLYGEPIVKACASSGTHYLDVSGETPWNKAMIEKYHSLAKSTGSIIIHQAGYESAPSDLLAFAIAQKLKAESLQTKEVILTVHKFVNGGPSGGTVASLFNAFSSYSLRELASSLSPSAFAASTVAKPLPKSTTTRILGVRKVNGLGTLTTSFQGIADIPLVYRSATLMKDDYGSNFHFTPWITVRNTAMAGFVHFLVLLLPLVLKISPLRWWLSKVLLRPGEGPTREGAAKDYADIRAIGVPDANTKRRAYSSVKWQGSAYHLTAVFLGEAAATILQDDDFPARKMGGGSMTPATLGQGFIDRLSKAKYTMETKMLE